MVVSEQQKAADERASRGNHAPDLVGWPAILAFMKMKDARTGRARRREGMPIVSWFGQVAAYADLLTSWAATRHMARSKAA